MAVEILGDDVCTDSFRRVPNDLGNASTLNRKVVNKAKPGVSGRQLPSRHVWTLPGAKDR